MSFVFFKVASAALVLCNIFYLNRRSYLPGYEGFVGILFLCVLLCSAKGCSWFLTFHFALLQSRWSGSGRKLESLTLNLRVFFRFLEDFFFHFAQWNVKLGNLFINKEGTDTFAFLQVLTFSWTTRSISYFFILLHLERSQDFLVVEKGKVLFRDLVCCSLALHPRQRVSAVMSLLYMW